MGCYAFLNSMPQKKTNTIDIYNYFKTQNYNILEVQRHHGKEDKTISEELIEQHYVNYYNVKKQGDSTGIKMVIKEGQENFF